MQEVKNILKQMQGMIPLVYRTSAGLYARKDAHCLTYLRKKNEPIWYYTFTTGLSARVHPSTVDSWHKVGP